MFAVNYNDRIIYSRDQLHVLINELGYKVGVEIGVEKGEYSRYLLENTDVYLYCIDSWQYIDGYDDVANISNEQHLKNRGEAIRTLAPFSNRCKIINAFSVEAAKEFEDGSLDFVYIDANHKYQYVKEDIFVWDKKVRMGGMLSGHDFKDGMYLVADQLSEFGVMSAVYDYLKDKSYRLYFTENELWPTWYVIKE